MARKYDVDGKTIQLLTIGEVSEELNRTAQTIRLWEKKGIIPPAPYNFGERGFGLKGRRLYTNLHGNVLKTAILKEGLKQGTPISKSFTQQIMKAYKEIAEGKYPKLLEEFNNEH